MVVPETHHRNRQSALPLSRAQRKLILIWKSVTQLHS